MQTPTRATVHQRKIRTESDTLTDLIQSGIEIELQKLWRDLYIRLRHLNSMRSPVPMQKGFGLAKNSYMDYHLWWAFQVRCRARIMKGILAGMMGLSMLERAYWEKRVGKKIVIDTAEFARDFEDQLALRITQTTQTLQRQVAKEVVHWFNTPGMKMEDLVAKLRPEFGERRAGLIAITEIGNLHSGVQERLAENLGITEWWWSTRRDQSVCTRKMRGPDGIEVKGCAALQGRVFKLGQPMPPKSSHPGCFCRGIIIAPEPVHKIDWITVLRKDWDETEHPRGGAKNPGQFAPKGEGGNQAMPGAPNPRRVGGGPKPAGRVAPKRTIGKPPVPPPPPAKPKPAEKPKPVPKPPAPPAPAVQPPFPPPPPPPPPPAVVKPVSVVRPPAPAPKPAAAPALPGIVRPEENWHTVFAHEGNALDYKTAQNILHALSVRAGAWDKDGDEWTKALGDGYHLRVKQTPQRKVGKIIGPDGLPVAGMAISSAGSLDPDNFPEMDRLADNLQVNIHRQIVTGIIKNPDAPIAPPPVVPPPAPAPAPVPAPEKPKPERNIPGAPKKGKRYASPEHARAAMEGDYEAMEKEAAPHREAIKKLKSEQSPVLLAMEIERKVAGDRHLSMEARNKAAIKHNEMLAKIRPLMSKEKELKRKIDALKEKYMGPHREALRVDNPTALNCAIEKIGADKAKIAQAGLDAFQGLVSDDLWNKPGARKAFIRGGRGRSFYAPGLHEVRFGSDSSVRSIVHELGHHLEHSNPAIKIAVKEFHTRRTAGEKLQRLRNLVPGSRYGAGEVAKPDKFIDPYMGKMYPDGSTEILSMGLEHYYANPVEFAKKDPEYFDLIWNIAHGKIQ